MVKLFTVNMLYALGSCIFVPFAHFLLGFVRAPALLKMGGIVVGRYIFAHLTFALLERWERGGRTPVKKKQSFFWKQAVSPLLFHWVFTAEPHPCAGLWHRHSWAPHQSRGGGVVGQKGHVLVVAWPRQGQQDTEGARTHTAAPIAKHRPGDMGSRQCPLCK